MKESILFFGVLLNEPIAINKWFNHNFPCSFGSTQEEKASHRWLSAHLDGDQGLIDCISLLWYGSALDPNYAIALYPNKWTHKGICALRLEKHLVASPEEAWVLRAATEKLGMAASKPGWYLVNR